MTDYLEMHRLIEKARRSAARSEHSEALVAYNEALEIITRSIPELRDLDKAQAIQARRKIQVEIELAKENEELQRNLRVYAKKNALDLSRDPEVWSRSKTKGQKPRPSSFIPPKADNRAKISPNTSAEITLNIPKVNDGTLSDASMDCIRAVESTIKVQTEMETWEAIIGCEDAKTSLQQALVLPVMLPEYFKGVRRPWKSILLYGPPGNGKTLLAQAAASQANATFFNISISSLMSKWRGESEKLVTCLFEMARERQPAMIFFDEMDALMTQRGASGEHEASRRLKAELLIQLDATLKDESMVFVLGATNLPWDIDSALLRRFERSIYIGLPDEASIKKLLEKALTGVRLAPDLSIDDLATQLAGYSSAEILLICRNAALMEVERLTKQISLTDLSMSMLDQPITREEFIIAIKNKRPVTSHTTIEQFIKYRDGET